MARACPRPDEIDSSEVSFAPPLPQSALHVTDHMTSTPSHSRLRTLLLRVVSGGLAMSFAAAATVHAATSPTLIFWIFLHDDTLGVKRQQIHDDYVAWWLGDMKKILPTHRLRVIYSQQVRGVTDIPYGHESSLQDWTTAVESYVRSENLPTIRGSFEFKFMLLTSDEVAPGVSGLAWLGGDQAMASLKGRYTIVAHEFGHTLTAAHENAEVRWTSGWPCETNLKSAVIALRANCYRYTESNERLIRRHMANEWTVPVSQNIPDVPRHIAN
jgi:hypothetical protein